MKNLLGSIYKVDYYIMIKCYTYLNRRLDQEERTISERRIVVAQVPNRVISFACFHFQS
jgi:hypothetical protein